MIRLCLLLLLLAAPVHAQVATVRTGEHDIFSRIVVEAPGSTDWRFGRTDDGLDARRVLEQPGQHNALACHAVFFGQLLD